MSSGEVTVRLPAELKARLDALSDSTGRPAAAHVVEALELHLDELEWADSVDTRAEALRRGADRARGIDDVARDLGFDPADLRDEAARSDTS